jgi:hypothetical protein
MVSPQASHLPSVPSRTLPTAASASAKSRCSVSIWRWWRSRSSSSISGPFYLASAFLARNSTKRLCDAAGIIIWSSAPISSTLTS